MALSFAYIDILFFRDASLVSIRSWPEHESGNECCVVFIRYTSLVTNLTAETNSDREY